MNLKGQPLAIVAGLPLERAGSRPDDEQMLCPSCLAVWSPHVRFDGSVNVVCAACERWVFDSAILRSLGQDRMIVYATPR